MMPTLSCHVDQRTMETLQQVSAERGCTVEHLAECAIAETAIAERRDRFTRLDASPITRKLYD